MISVIIPVYNGEKNLKECIDSILNQTYSDLEIILVDDGSKDLSGKICDSYSQMDFRIKVIHQENQGVSAARNKGLDVATGDYITFVDSDDRLEADMYEFLLDLAEEYGADIAHCGYKRIDEKGHILKEINGTHTLLIQNSQEALECMLTGRHFVPSLCNKLFKASLFDNIHFEIDLRINEDVLVAFEVFQRAKKIVFADETKYCYLVHETSACHVTEQFVKVRNIAQASERMLKKCQIEPLVPLLTNRLVGNLGQVYRYILLNSGEKNINERKIFRRELQDKLNHSTNVSFRNYVNCFFMIHFPHLYTVVYKVYDRIRTPQWDAKV